MAEAHRAVIEAALRAYFEDDGEMGEVILTKFVREERTTGGLFVLDALLDHPNDTYTKADLTGIQTLFAEDDDD